MTVLVSFLTQIQKNPDGIATQKVFAHYLKINHLKVTMYCFLDGQETFQMV